LKEDIDSLSSQVESAKSGNELDHNETMAQFESRINKLKEERDQFYGIVQEREIQIEQMQKVDDEKSEEVILLKERSQEVALFKQDVEKMSAERQALETENQNMKANCEQLNDKLKGCDTEIQELIVLKDTLKEKLNFQLEETNKIKDSLSKFEEDKEILQSEITVLKSSANQNEETMKELLSTAEERSSLEKEVVEKHHL
jgi:chromosome segregation ATPase